MNLKAIKERCEKAKATGDVVLAANLGMGDLPEAVSWIERAKGLLSLLLSEPFYLEAYVANIQEEARKLQEELES